jgi:uncharacterized protein (TIGR03083 family)
MAAACGRSWPCGEDSSVLGRAPPPLRRYPPADEHDAAQRIATLRRSHDDLVRFVDDFDERLLETGSGAAEWTVAQVLGHLGSGAEIGTARCAPPWRVAPLGPRPWCRSGTAGTPCSLDALAAFRQSDERLVALYEGLDAATLDDLRVDLGFLPAPIDVATTVTFRLSEHALHSWDVHVAFERAAVLAPYMVPFLTEHISRLAAWTARPAGRTGRVRIETTEPEQHLLLELGDRVSLGPDPDPAGEAGTTLRLPTEALVRMAAGRLGPAHTPDTVAIEGDLTLDDLRAVFPGY